MSNLKFNPMLTPSEMLKRGVFGGSYFGDKNIAPSGWDYGLLFRSFKTEVTKEMYLGEKYKAKLNKFKIRSGMSYQYWKDMGWIHPDDPYGWFEWYVKYYAGRRHSDDDRQIQRWIDFCGSKGRWRNNIYKKIHDTGDWGVSPRTQQSLLHWGYMVNEPDYILWCKVNNKIYEEDEWCSYGGLPSPKAYE